MTPKKKARKAIKAKVRDIVQRSGATPMRKWWRRSMPHLLVGVNYFRVGNASGAFSEVRQYAEMKVRTLFNSAETAAKDEHRMAEME